MENAGGYAGRLLRVDLTSGKIAVEELNWESARKFIGGRGYCTKVLFDEVPEGTDPLGPNNKVIYGTGPLTGTPVPGSGRHIMVTKSPATNLFADTYAGGHFAPEMKFAGYDFIVIEGKAPRPSYIAIYDENVKIRDATHLWGKTTWETETLLKEEVRDRRARVSVIGPAGENLSNLAIVQNDYYHQCARGGVGAVMGSKNLKAVVVRGEKSIKVARPKHLLNWLTDIEKTVQASMEFGVIPNRMKMGTPLTLNITNEVGVLPTKNFKYGDFEGASGIDGYAFRERVIADTACFACNLGCTKVTKAGKGPYAGAVVGGPEYETDALLGSNCGIDSIDAMIYANVLCDSLGIDTVGAGNVIAWAMECYEKGILTKNDTGGIELRFGSESAVFEMIKRIATREGLGDILARGVKQASDVIGQGSEKFAMHTKGLEYPAYRPGPVSPAWGLFYAITERGACHRRGWPTQIEKDKLEQFSTEGRAELVKRLYDQRIPWHCGLTCDIVVMFFGLNHAHAAISLSAVTGWDISEEEIQKLCERVASLVRAFNIREGATRVDDTLAPRSFEPDPRGKGEGKALTKEMLDTMLDEYYSLRGWDKNGVPSQELLTELGIGDVAFELKKAGKTWTNKSKEVRSNEKDGCRQ